MIRRLLLITGSVLVVALLVAACGGDSDADEPGTVSGIVTEVTGDLSNVEAFVVLDDSGDSYRFVPEAGLTFHGGPLSHLREHIVSGETITVTFERRDDGQMTAVLIEHG